MHARTHTHTHTHPDHIHVYIQYIYILCRDYYGGEKHGLRANSMVCLSDNMGQWRLFFLSVGLPTTAHIP